MSDCRECVKSTVCKYNDGVNEWCKGSCPEFINDNQVLNNPSISNIPQKAIWFHSADGIYCSHCWNKLEVTGIPQMCPYCYSQMTDNGWGIKSTYANNNLKSKLTGNFIKDMGICYSHCKKK